MVKDCAKIAINKAGNYSEVLQDDDVALSVDAQLNRLTEAVG